MIDKQMKNNLRLTVYESRLQGVLAFNIEMSIKSLRLTFCFFFSLINSKKNGKGSFKVIELDIRQIS